MHFLKIFILFTISFLGNNLYAQDSISIEQQEINLLKEKVDGLEKSIEKSDEHSSELMDEKAKQHEMQYEKLDERLSNSIWAATIIGSVVIAVFTFLGRNLLIEFIDKNLQSQTKKITSEKINDIITEDWVRSEVEEKVKVPINRVVGLLQEDFKKKSGKIFTDSRNTLTEIQDELELRRTELEGLGIANKSSESTALEKLRLKDYKDNLEESKSESEFTADDWFWKGREEIEREDYDEALKSFTRSIELDSADSIIWNNRGHLFLELGKYHKAISDLDEAIKLDNKNYYAWNNRGFAKTKLRQYQEALSDFKEALNLNDQSAFILGNRGFLYNELGDYNKALSDYDKAIDLDPQLSNAWNNRGFAKNGLRMFQEALLDFNKAIELDPLKTKTYAHRAYSNLCLGNIEKAEDDINHAIKLNPEYDRAYYNQGLIKQEQKKKEEACFAWKKALELGFEDAQEKLDEFCTDQSSKTPNV